ncbi:MAG: magnesium transporter CorA family protein [Candidatus Buchananbacteria bacterium]|nr:magnesium transporter CorA family protein [Candidatus Buchananbacteria bacterium]
MGQTKKIEFKHFEWINITDPGKKEIENLGEKYKFHPLDLQDCLNTSYRSKIDTYDEYTFLVLLFPVYDYETREIVPSEIDVFISSEYLITINHGNIKPFDDFFDLFRVTSTLREKYTDRSPERLFYEILNKLILYVFPMVDHLNDDCNKIEKAIFSGREKRMIWEILIIRRNITDFRKIMQVHKNVLKKAVNNFKDSNLYAIKKTDAYFESLVDYTKEIWDMMENLKERIEALQQTNESQISFKVSDIMRILTIISVITFPVTLLATVFGMNTVHAMPFVNNPNGFWYVIGVMTALITAMIAIFKKKGWM